MRFARTPSGTIALFVIAVVFALALSVTSAFAGSIMGTVTDGVGPVSGVSVSAWRFSEDDGQWLVEKSVNTLANGGYSLTGLVGGQYVVEFKDDTYAHVSEFYDGEDGVATPSPYDSRILPLNLGASASLSAINAQLASGGAISGKVTAEAGGANLANITVESFVFAEESGGMWSSYNQTTTDVNGDYTLTGLPAGTVRVRFAGAGFVTEMHSNIKTMNANDIRCTGVAIADGGTTAVSAQLAVGVPVQYGAISGTVTKAGTGVIGGVLVEAFLDSGAVDPDTGLAILEYTDSAVTDGSGDYLIEGLVSGDYRLRFSTPDGSCLTECYNNVADADPAAAACTPVTVTGSATESGIDAELAVASRISGTITDDVTGALLSDIEVTAWRWDIASTSWVVAGQVSSNGVGVYSVGGLVSGDYRLRFDDPMDAYLSEYWNNVQAADVADPAVTSIPVGSAAIVSGKNAQLKRDVPPPVPADAFEQDDSYLAARLVNSDRTEAHSIDALSDADWIKIDGRSANTYTFATGGAMPLDTIIRVRNAVGAVVSSNDDIDATGFSRLEYNPASNGIFYVEVVGRETGYYTLSIAAADETAPTTQSNAAPSYVGSGVITLTSTDDWSGLSATYYRVDAGVWTAGAVVTVSGTGTHTVSYYSTDKAGNGEQPVTKTVVITSVAKPKVSLGTPMAPKTMKAKRGYTVYGSLKPKHTSGTKPVRIYKYKKVSGKWKSYGYVKATASNYSTYTRYKVKMSLPSKGSWRLRAYAPADSKHAATWSSKYDYVTVK